ncbi:MAG: DUF2782 domain-containing protein [Rhodanobacteraceae bacterium]
MRTSIGFLSICMLLGSALAIAAPPAPQKTSPPNDLPPPPGINDPGVSSPAPQAAPASDAPIEELVEESDDPLAPLPKPDTRPVRDKSDRGASPERMAASEVTKRTQGTDTVEEYRQNGRVWMIRIVPQNGPTQTFMDSNGSGRLTRNPQEGPISPVYFSLYEWN